MLNRSPKSEMTVGSVTTAYMRPPINAVVELSSMPGFVGEVVAFGSVGFGSFGGILGECI